MPFDRAEFSTDFGTKKFTSNFELNYRYLGKSLVKNIGIRSYKWVVYF